MFLLPSIKSFGTLIIPQNLCQTFGFARPSTFVIFQHSSLFCYFSTKISGKTAQEPLKI